jgi:3-hydroxyacyl-[acyl-carrier-protein] dehydratase
MRWFWVDRFTEFVRGEKASAVKNVTLSDEPIDDYLIGYPHYPHSLIVEGVAQTGGLLIAEAGGFLNRVVLAKVGKAEFHCLARPGDQLTVSVVVQDMQSSGGIVHATVTIDGKLQANLEMSFAFLDDRFGSEPLFPPDDLMRTLRILRIYDVAVDRDGNRVKPPAHLSDAEVRSTA